jgi:tetratricopeptide (TPR) repeat protein
MRCDACGIESDFDAGFVKQRTGVAHQEKSFCADCWVKRGNFRRGWFLPVLLFAAAFGYVTDKSTAGGSDLGRLIMNIAGVGLFTILTIIPHELGHVVAARALGWHVYQVVIGMGPQFFKRRWFGILFDFRTLPVAGGTWLVPKDMRVYRLKRFLIILAGPAVNAGMAIGLLLILAGSARNLDFDSLPNWANLFILANVFVLIVNLWPYQPKGGMGIATDGKELLQLISFNKKARAHVLAQRFALEAYMCREQGQIQRARELLDEGLASVPEDLYLLNLSAIVCLDETRYEQAREIFLKLLKTEKQAPAAKFVLLNNLAYADVLSENAEFLQEADSYSRDAFAALPWMPAVAGTRGAVLAAMGTHEEGLALLKKSMEDTNSPRSKAENACIIASALAKIGRKPEAEKYLRLARQLDGKCPLLARAAKAVGGGERVPEHS